LHGSPEGRQVSRFEEMRKVSECTSGDIGDREEGRQSEKVAAFILGEVKKSGIETELIDVRDYSIPATDNTEESSQAKKLSKKMARADGLIIVSPDTTGLSGELKMTLDMLYDDYAGSLSAYAPSRTACSAGEDGGAAADGAAVRAEDGPHKHDAAFPEGPGALRRQGAVIDKATTGGRRLSSTRCCGTRRR